MSRVQTRAPLAEGEAPGARVAAVEAEIPNPVERLVTLAAEARRATEDRQAGMVGALNMLITRLSSEVGPDLSAPVLTELLEQGRLDGLVDEDGVPSSAAATRALLNLGYPRALEVPPERLEALRRWERTPLPVPLGAIAVTLFLAFVVQVGIFTLHDMRGPMPWGVSADVLAGIQKPPEPTWMDQVEHFADDISIPVFFGQQLANFLAFLCTWFLGGTHAMRPLVRRAFLGIAVLGGLAGCLQMTLGALLAAGTLTSAAGSLLVGWLLKERGSRLGA